MDSDNEKINGEKKSSLNSVVILKGMLEYHAG